MEKGKMDSFQTMGLNKRICEACKKNLGWKSATEVQKAVIPIAIAGKDVIALAETGSGKTAAYCLPLINRLLMASTGLYALILVPTRELAFQVIETIDSIAKDMGFRSAAVVGGVDIISQAIEISSNPHVLVATPGRLVAHIEKTNDWSLGDVQYLVFDEADKMLNLGFEQDIDKIIKNMSKKRQTLLFSATMTSKVQKLKRAHLNKPQRIEISTKFQTVDSLREFMIFVPFSLKISYLVAMLKKLGNSRVLIFCEMQFISVKISLVLNHCGLNSVTLVGNMKQAKRIKALEEFKKNDQSILVATDVCSRGLDIPDINYVINYDLPKNCKDYIHRVGRTARAGRAGISITIVSQYHIEAFMSLEKTLGSKMPQYKEVVEAEAVALSDEVAEGSRHAKMAYKLPVTIIMETLTVKRISLPYTFKKNIC